MTTKTKSPKRAGSFTLGRSRFAKISAIEGITLSQRMDKAFREFEQTGLSAAERRRTLAGKYIVKV